MSKINDIASEDFLTYATEVIKSRAIPYADDNLKPVHRRILYGMYLLKVFSNKPKVKSA
jgi:DNA gyrase/topoisomerase IV subunit A